MNLDCHDAQDGRKAAIVFKEVEAARGYFESASTDEVPTVAASDPRSDKAMLFQIKHVADDGCVIGHQLNFLPSFSGKARVCVSQLLQNRALQVSVKFHKNPPVVDDVVVGTTDSTTRGDAGGEGWDG